MDIQRFVNEYAESNISRFHMPGHKGRLICGAEGFDITEICGADSLYDADGIIAQSENKCAEAFGSAKTCYGAEGSSQTIKAALLMLRRFFGRDIKLLSSRSCHRAFLDGCMLIGADPIWLGCERDMLCKSDVTPLDIETALERERIDAVYITSPDYYGTLADIRAIADICHAHKALLIVDNAHGAYLKFAPGRSHPIDNGADIVCDSAHKTLPVYTGGAYLHISNTAPAELIPLAKPCMAAVGSSSPSYLILASLDSCTDMLYNGLPKKISACCERVGRIKELIKRRGLSDISSEPLKITLGCAEAGYSGVQAAELMRQNKMECEYADVRAVVLMISPFNDEEDLVRLEKFIQSFEIKESIVKALPKLPKALPKAMPLREAMLASSESVLTEAAEGRICARPALSCQPSVAVAMPGEVITHECIAALKGLGIERIEAVKKI